LNLTGKINFWKQGLWSHQINAVNKIRKYIKSDSKGSVLIRMPTGTGKSGIIAVITRCFKDTPNSLVIVPGKYLRDQLKRDVKERFWKRIDTNPENLPNKEVKSFVPHTVKEILYKSRETNTIFICTIQTLQRIYSKKENKNIYNELKKRISIVIFDEGHREPAPEWAKAVRSLKKPTILFSATPYRNDYKQFNVDPSYIFKYTYQQAVKDKYIREVEFREVKVDSSENFVEELLKFYEEFQSNLKPNGISESRVIIRCETNTDVNKIANILKQKGRKVIAIHDRFANDKKDFHRKDVPNPEEVDFTFWVHQNKLIESIDDPRFCVLAIYQPLKNAKQLVQQIGRIIRNPWQKKDQKAYVFTNLSYGQSDYWKGYLEYEKKFGLEPTPQQIFNKIIKILPKYNYFKGNYRERFDFKDENLYKQFIYPLSANIYEIESSFSMRNLVKAIEKDWFDADRDIRKKEIPDNDTRVFVYITYTNSPILYSRYLFIYSIGFTIVHISKPYLFFYDTQGNSCDYLTKNVKMVDPDVLERLFSKKNTRISEISLMNMDLGRYSIRRRTLHARSIKDTAPNLVDYANFISTSRGYVENEDKQQIQRYIGFTKGKISDHLFVYRKYKDYINWLDSLANLIKSNKKSLALFDRFASFTNPPKNTTPINILLDIDDARESFVTASPPPGKKKKEELYVNDVCYKIKGGKFNFTANSQEYKVAVTYDKNRKVYKLKSRKLENAYVMKETGEQTRLNLITYLNYHQSFRIIPKTSGIIYAHSKFYKPNLPIYGKKGKIDLLKILIPVKKLAEIKSEKGKKCNLDGWQKDSLFYLIDTLGKDTELSSQFGNGINHLICDDMGTEVADFIAASTKQQQIIFIHAKAFTKVKKRSATAFHEICSQTIKNLEFLSPYSTQKPSKLNRWDKPWKNGTIGSVRKRIRIGNKDANSTWKEIRNIIRNPSASREIWILLGSGFSRKDFDAELNKPTPTPEIIQIIYLLQSTWSVVSSVGATLKIFCSP